MEEGTEEEGKRSTPHRQTQVVERGERVGDTAGMMSVFPATPAHTVTHTHAMSH